MNLCRKKLRKKHKLESLHSTYKHILILFIMLLSLFTRKEKPYLFVCLRSYISLAQKKLIIISYDISYTLKDVFTGRCMSMIYVRKCSLLAVWRHIFYGSLVAVWVQDNFINLFTAVTVKHDWCNLYINNNWNLYDYCKVNENHITWVYQLYEDDIKLNKLFVIICKTIT